MEIIDANWLRRHLKGTRGELKQLAEAVRLTPDKITKIVKGERTIRAHEIPLFLAHFEGPPPPGMAEAQQPFDGISANLVEITPLWDIAIRALCPGTRHPAVYRMNSDAPGAMLARGDCLIVDLNRPPDVGGLVLVTIGDPETGDYHTEVRRYIAPHLAKLTGGLLSQPISSDPSQVSAVMATVSAVVRLP